MRYLFVLALLLPSIALAQPYSCTKFLRIYSATDLTATATGTYIKTPREIGNYYISTNVTEDSAGSLTLELNTNEAASATNDTVVDTLGSDHTATGEDVVDAGNVSGQAYLGPYIGVDVTALTGQWDITVDMYYDD